MNIIPYRDTGSGDPAEAWPARKLPDNGKGFIRKRRNYYEDSECE